MEAWAVVIGSQAACWLHRIAALRRGSPQFRNPKYRAHCVGADRRTGNLRSHEEEVSALWTCPLPPPEVGTNPRPFDGVGPIVHAIHIQASSVAMVTYLLACTTCLLLGYGVLSLLHLDRRLIGAIFAAPGLGAAIVILALVNGVLAGATISALTVIVVCSTVVLGTLGIVRLRTAEIGKVRTVGRGAVFLCPIVVLAPFFWWGLSAYPGSWFWDGWHYIAVAQYLLDQGLDGKFDASILHSHLGTPTELRFASSALIGFLSQNWWR